MHQNYGTAKPNPAHTYRHTNIHKLKGTVSVISSDPPCKDTNVRITTITLKVETKTDEKSGSQSV